MKKTIELAKVLFKSSLNIKDTSGKKTQVGKIVLRIILLICIIPFIILLYNVGFLGYHFDNQNGSTTFIGALIFVVSAGICLTGIAACINSFYFANNNNSLFVLPLNPTQIAGAKLIVATLYEYYLSFAILAPFLIGYGVAGEKSIIYWIGVVVAVLLLPIVPMAYAGIISIVFMRIFKGIKGKGKMPIISAIAVFIFTIIITALSRISDTMDVKSIEDVVTHLSDTLKKITVIFVDIPFISEALTKQNLLFLLLAIVVTAVVLLLFWIAAKYLYFSAAIGRGEKSASRRVLDATEVSKFSTPRGIAKSYTIKELRMVSRDSACFMQCFLLCLGWPVLIIASALFSQKGGYEVQLLDKLISLSEDFSIQFICILFAVVLVVTLFAAAFNAMAPTAISREGKGYMLIKQLPIPYKIHLKAKRNAALCISAIGSTVYLLIGGILLIILKGFPWWAVLLGLVMNFLLLIIILDIEMILGLQKAKLDWESESDIMGKNIIGVVIFFLGLVVVAVVAMLAVSLYLSDLTIQPMLFGAILIVALAILAFVFEKILYTYGPKKMEALS